MRGRRACSARRAWRSSDGARPSARAARPEQVVRRARVHLRPRPARGRGGDRERHRPQRRRQDDAVQRHHRRVPARRRGDPPRRQEPRRAGAAPGHEPRCRPDVPDAAPVPEHDRARERDGGAVRQDEDECLRVDAAAAARASRGAGDPAASRGEAVVLRAAARRLPLGSARVQALVRGPPPPGDCTGDGDGAAHPAAGRARGRDEPVRDARDHGADREAARGARLHDPRDRARHARRRRHLRPCRRARPRRQDRGGDVRRGRDQSPRRRGVPRPAQGGDEMSTNGAAPLLRLAEIHTSYGKKHILERLSIEVREGELVSLLGGNASGKSTTLKTILGLVQPRNGKVEFFGEDVTGRTTSYRIRKGMAIVPENRRLFGPMTVLENLEMGAYLRSEGRGRKEDYERVYSLFPLLHERRSQLAGTLSGGEQQMVAMGRAMMSQPKLLLMDEPSMGLAPILVERSFEIIQQVHQSGVAMLIVEQNANMALSIADRGYVLSTGRLVLEGRANELLEHEDLRKAYLGR